jgi:NADH-quinone oxidoreductase subunit L
VFLAGFGLAWLLYVGKRDPDAEAPLRAAAPGRAAYVKQWLAYAFTRDWPRAFAEGAGAPVYKAVVNKFWVDELYQGLVVTPIRVGAALLWFVVDRLIIDAILVGGPGWLAYRLGAGVRRLHTGSIAVAVALLVLGAAAVVGFDIIVRFFK